MSLRVAVSAELLISQDDSNRPSEPSFDSGAKSFIDDQNYAYHIGDTVKIAANAVDAQLYLGSLAEADILYFLAKGAGLSIKLVPVGSSLGATSALSLVTRAPSILCAKVSAIYVSNSTASPVDLVIGAAGN